MWVRKTEQELNTEEQKTPTSCWSPAKPFAYSIPIGLLLLIYDFSFTAFLAGALGGFALLYLAQLFVGGTGTPGLAHLLVFGSAAGYYPKTDSYFCPRCHTPQELRDEGCKACNTPLEKLSHWKWQRGRKPRRKRFIFPGTK